LSDSGLQLLLNGGDGRAGQNVAVRQHAQQVQALALEAAPGEFGDVIQFVGSDLVENDADDFHSLAFKNRLVEIDLVDRFADAALADDDDLGPRILATCALDKIEHRTDAGVARAFAQDKILFPRHAVEGLA
jgi:hypothetical protein